MTDMLNEHLKRLKPYQKRICDGILPHYIGGAPCLGASEQTFENITPVDNSKLCDVARGSARDIDRASKAAEAAFPEWRKASGKARKQILHKIADLIVARGEEIALLECIDTGQTIRFMKAAAERSAANYRYFADRAPEAGDGLALPSEEHMNYTTRIPIGPVGVITPWNTPFMLSTWKIAPALAAGCSVVHKPAEWSPLTATILAEISQEAGLPEGLHNLVQGFGEDVGVALTEHEAIKAIAFVGESSTGSKIMAQGALGLKRVHFELGGKNPVIVFEDAALERALDAAIFMIYSLNGERCTSSSRLLVQRSIHDEFVTKLAKRVRNIRVGHPLDPETEIGPLIHPVHFDKVMSYRDIARSDGATVAVGGSRASFSGEGNFINATLFTDARSDMRIAQEEIFGPVLTVIPFEDEAEAIQIGNDVRYGLAGYLWTRDVGKAHRVAHALDAGMIWVNSQNIRHLPSPFGGAKMSGIGRDGGDYSFDFYMETKNVCIAFGDHRIPQLGVA
ncbi:MAG: 5-carboxymethyl-2-hydroxymuconate semialdehyde dehydrogenase [Rhodospirillaceae bacterium]|nr:5-carboxymethyl-2-hydroxymuconate semialdehyde dehydrogenase [Rhodospirillaceae bacterium]